MFSALRLGPLSPLILTMTSIQRRRELIPFQCIPKRPNIPLEMNDETILGAFLISDAVPSFLSPFVSVGTRARHVNKYFARITEIVENVVHLRERLSVALFGSPSRFPFLFYDLVSNYKRKTNGSIAKQSLARQLNSTGVPFPRIPLII